MVLSGDHDAEQKTLQYMLGTTTPLYFKQSPADKLQKIEALQLKGKNVMMIGDGLNDAGALRQSDVGIAITDQANYFSPASDIIMDVNLVASITVKRLLNKTWKWKRFTY